MPEFLSRSRFIGAAAVAFAVAAAWGAPGAEARESGTEARAGNDLCAPLIEAMEAAEGIPDHLLAAISHAESGRADPETGEIIAWPWTINAGGEGHYFETKAEAIEAVEKLRARGVESIDVGCMQVNLYHHPDAFGSLEEAFDPAANVAYAAAFLKDLHAAQRSWARAVAFYHSATWKLGYSYRRQVYRHWGEVRRAEARKKQEAVLRAYRERRAAAEAARHARDPS